MGWYTGRIYLKSDRLPGNVKPPLKHAGWISGTAIDWPTYQPAFEPPRVQFIPTGSMAQPAAPERPFSAFRNRTVVVRLHEGSYVGHLMRMASSPNSIKQIEIHIPRSNNSVACLLVSVLIEGLPKSAPGATGQVDVPLNAVVGIVGPLISPLAAD